VKLRARVNDHEHDLTLSVTDKAITVEVDGRVYNLEVRRPDPDGYLIVNRTHVFDCRVDATSKARDTFNVNLNGSSHSITLINPKRLRSDQNSDHHHHGSAEIIAPMAGKVVRVLVEAGHEIEKSAGVLVVEAMKMQNEMKSPRSGKLVSIKVKPGDTVNAGEVLAVVE
jgi:biotin carboxyl carrier protein